MLSHYQDLMSVIAHIKSGFEIEARIFLLQEAVHTLSIQKAIISYRSKKHSFATNIGVQITDYEFIEQVTK